MRVCLLSEISRMMEVPGPPCASNLYVNIYKFNRVGFTILCVSHIMNICEVLSGLESLVPFRTLQHQASGQTNKFILFFNPIQDDPPRVLFPMI